MFSKLWYDQKFNVDSPFESCMMTKNLSTYEGSARLRLLRALTICYQHCSLQGKKIGVCHAHMLRLVEQSPRLWRLGSVLIPIRQWLGIFPKRLWQLSDTRPAVSKQILNIMSGVFTRSRSIRITCEENNTNLPVLLSALRLRISCCSLPHGG